MKIDLHLHTFLSKSNGDSIKWNSLNETITQLYKHHVKMFAFTDHNTFDANLYIEAKEFAKTGGLVCLPGFELNVIRKNDLIGHMLIIFSDLLSSEQLKNIESTIRQKIRKSGVHINQVNELFNEYETIRIIHVGKNDFFDMEDIKNLNYDAFEITNYHHPNYILFNNNGILSSVVAFSDTHMWNDYPQQKNLYTDIDLDELTFKNLKEKLSTKKDYVKENW